jgi:hypothetical protein
MPELAPVISAVVPYRVDLLEDAVIIGTTYARQINAVASRATLLPSYQHKPNLRKANEKAKHTTEHLNSL